MNLEKIQNLLIRMALDHGFFVDFSTDRNATLKRLKLQPQDIALANELNLAEFEIFREVIRGTRSYRFREFFKRLAHHIGNIWEDVLREFHEKTVIKTSRNDRDMELFVNFICEKFTDSPAADAAKLDFALYQLSLFGLKEAAFEHTPVSPSCTPFRDERSRGVMMRFPLAAVNAEEDCSKCDTFLICIRSPTTNNIDLFEVEPEIYRIYSCAGGKQNIADIALGNGLTLEKTMEASTQLQEGGAIRIHQPH